MKTLFLFIFLIYLEKIRTVVYLIDQKVYTNSTKDIIYMTNNNFSLDMFTLTFYMKFKSILIFNENVNESSLLIIKNSKNINKYEVSFKSEIQNNYSNITFKLKVNNLEIFKESFQPKKSLDLNWIFFALKYQNNTISWYIEDTLRGIIISNTYSLADKAISIESNDTLNINDNSIRLNIELSKLIVIYNESIDFYNMKNFKLKDPWILPFEADPDCINFDTKQGLCMACSSSMSPLLNVCPTNNKTLIEYKYFDGLTNRNEQFYIKSKLNQSISKFDSKKYSISLWYRNIGYNNSEEREIFSIGIPKDDPSTKPLFNTYCSLKFSKLNTENFNLNFYKSDHMINLLNEDWYFLVFTFDVLNKNITALVESLNEFVVFNFTGNFNEIPMEHLNEISYINFGENNLIETNPFYGIIADFRIYYNGILSYSDINKIFYLRNSFSSPYKTKLPIDCNRNYPIYFNGNFSCQYSSYIDFRGFEFYHPLKNDSLQEYSIDFWFYSKINFKMKRSYYILWLNNLDVTIQVSNSLTSLICNPNPQLDGNVNNNITLPSLESIITGWNYFKCSLSKSLKKYIAHFNDLKYSLDFTTYNFIVPRNSTNNSYLSITTKNSNYSRQDQVFLLRELRIFDSFISLNVDIRYKSFTKLQYYSLISYFPLNELYVSLNVYDNSFTYPKPVKLNVINNYTGELILTNDFVNLTICKNDEIFQSNNCFNSSKMKNCKSQNSNSKCIECEDGFFLLQNSTCALKCPDNNFVGPNDDCLNCSYGCSECNSNNSCIKCLDSRVNPELSFYLNKDNNVCYTCHPNCLTCDSFPNCLTCRITDKLENSTCKRQCNSNMEIYSDQLNRCINLQNLTMSIVGKNNVNILNENNFTLNLIVMNDKIPFNESKLIASLNFIWSVDNFSQNFLILRNESSSLFVMINNKLSINSISPEFSLFVYFNNQLLNSIKKIVNLDSYKLVCQIKNENKLVFFLNSNITLDASLSYDEMDKIDKATRNSSESNMIFSWECPQELNKSNACKSINNSKLIIPNYEYMNYLDTKIYQFFNFNLKIFKDFRNATKSVNVLLITPSFNDLVEIVKIDQASYRTLTFQVKIDNSIKNNIFNYYWDIDNFFEKETFLNGRNQNILQINTNLLKLQTYIIKCNVRKESNPPESVNITYNYTKPSIQREGRCTVDPLIGVFFFQNFTFQALDWESKVPLIYNFLAENEKGLMIKLNNKENSQIFTSNMIPVGNNFKLEVTNSEGYIKIISCKVNVTESTNISFNDINEINNTNDKLIMMSSFTSSTPNLNKSLITNVLNTLKDSLTNDSKIINIGLEIINSLSKNSNNLNTLLDSHSDTVKKMYEISFEHIKDDSITESLYDITNNILSFNRKNNSYKITNTNDSSQKIDDSFHNNFVHLSNQLNEKFLNSIVIGSSKTIDRPMFKVDVNKLSQVTINSFSINNIDSSKVGRRILINKVESNNKCNNESIICISENKMKDLYNVINPNNSENNGLAILSMYNKNNLVSSSNQRQFTRDSVNLTILQFSIQNPELDLTDFHYNLSDNFSDKPFQFFLNIDSSMFYKPNSTEINYDLINETVCVIKSPKFKFNQDSCESWYDYQYSKVICICNQPGFLTNIIDKTISEFRKLFQFSMEDLINPSFWSWFIVLLLIIVFLGILLIFSKNYSRDKINQIKELQKFDSYQHSYVHFIRNKLHSNKSLIWLFKYTLKAHHRFSEIGLYYSKHYSKSLRIIDFFLRIYLTIFISLLPLYYKDDETKISILNKRDINNLHLNLRNLPLKFKEFLIQLIYSLIASTVTYIILMIINFIYFENVSLKSISRRKFYLQKFIDIISKQQNKREWIYKLKSVFVKLRAMKYLCEHFCDHSIDIKYNVSKISNQIDFKNEQFNTINNDGINKIKTSIYLEMENLTLDKNENSEKFNNKLIVKGGTNLFPPEFEFKNKTYENKAVTFFKNKIKLPLSNVLKERLLSNLNFENEMKISNLNNNLSKFDDSIDSVISINLVLKNQKFIKKENKYSMSFIGNHYMKIDLNEYNFETKEQYDNLSILSDNNFRRYGLNDFTETHYNYSIISSKINPNEKIMLIRKIIKIIISITMISCLLSYMMNLITVSYNNYGIRFFQLWTFPILLNLFTSLFIIEAIMKFLFCVILHFWGREVYFENKSKSTLKSFIINYIVPKQIVIMHKSILEFRNFYEKVKIN